MRRFVCPPNSLSFFISIVRLEPTGICVSADLYSGLYHIVATNTCFTPNFGIYNGVCLPTIVIQISTCYINSLCCKWSTGNHNCCYKTNYFRSQLLYFRSINLILSFAFDSFKSRTIFTNFNITYILLSVNLFLFLLYILFI